MKAEASKIVNLPNPKSFKGIRSVEDLIDIVTFKPEHMANIEKVDVDAKVLMFVDDIDSRAEAYAKAGPAVTMIDSCHHAIEDTVLAIGGVLQYWPGVGEAWMMVSPAGRKKALSLDKYMEGFLQVCFTDYGFHRIQASILNEHKDAHKCAFRLGFIPESMLVHYGPNKENFVRYVRLS